MTRNNKLATGFLGDLLKANVGQMNRHELRSLCRLSPITPVFRCISNLEHSMVESGWKLKDDRNIAVDGGVNFTVRLVDIFEGEEQVISGEELLKRAKEKGANYSQRFAEAMIRRQYLIPIEWRQYCLIFPETHWVDSSGEAYVPGIDYIDTWVIGFLSIGETSFFSRKNRLVKVLSPECR